ncbi:LytTR family transcriptional regulator [Oenococcus oeni]|uniref:HTH LytTR-type domain-containing protein n=7 Tax=Oenococcus oeni TaxID=1247 RepID=A0AAJ2UC95_OENOE|nr:hypothetical protein [Oenococcus oeni]QGR00642.1 LytTR family transcriptional regulator [Oenococcus oeni]TEU19677.1 LytTR family transcriptional regulator [Oenococcus oeni]TEU22134.1 LytTR family transcriptional regulator [Oenococcus oeni]TEU52132.1 LytTR family transcriptional regulator [Oenococcus oeni]
MKRRRMGMLVRFNISELFREPFITINVDRKTDELINMAVAIEEVVNKKKIIGYRGIEQKAISLYQIVSIHTDGKNVVCETKGGIYRIRKRIYEMKTVIPKSLFIQISNSEIVNISQIKNFSLSQTGIYQVNLLNGRKTYTSRRYTQIIRKELLK